MPVTNAFGNSIDSGALPGDLRPRPRRRRHRRLCGAAAGQRGARLVARARLRLSHQGDRRRAVGECRYPLRAGRRRGADHRHPDDRPGARDDVPADPRRPAGPAERADPAGAGRHRPDPDGRRPRQLARHLYGRHRDLARRRHHHRKGHAASPPRRSKPPRPTSASRTAIFVVAGTDRRIALLEVAALARDAGTPLDTYYAWTREWMTFPNGTHVAEVEIDRETGAVTLVALRRGRRLRRAGQPDGRRRPGAWRDRPGRRPGSAGARALRPEVGPAPRRVVHGLRAAARRRPAVLRARLQPDPLHDQPARRQGRGRGAVAAFPPSATRSSMPWRPWG